MKKVVSLFILAAFFVSCNKDLVKKPDNLIDREVMITIFHDLSLLEAIKYQNPSSLYDHGVNPKNYVFKKYNVSSDQFSKSNAYYAADYREYKKMFEELTDRLKDEKEAVDLINKKAAKKEAALKKLKDKKAKELKINKAKDSIEKVKIQEELKIKKKDSISKVKKQKSLKTKK